MEIVLEFPAFKIVSDKAREYADGEKIGVPYQSRNHGMLVNFYQLGCVAAYAEKYGEDPDAAVKQAEERGHEIYYAFGLGVCLHNGPKVQEVVPGFDIGDVIAYRGKRFEIKRAPNQNIKLVEVAA